MIDNEDAAAVGDGVDASPSAVERLANVRYQIHEARKQSRVTTPLASLALNVAQDAVESLLYLVMEERALPVNGNRPDFLQLFDAVRTGLTVDGVQSLQGHRSRLGSMNNARIAFKHHGNPTDKRTLLRHIVHAEQFVAELTQLAFGISITEATLVSFVRSQNARRLLTRAEANNESGDRTAAAYDLRLAFDEIVRDFKDRKRRSMFQSMYDLAPSPKPHHMELKEIDPKVAALGEWLENLTEWMEVGLLGLNARDYAFFRAHTPHVSYRPMGGPSAQKLDEMIVLSEETFERCFLFVLEVGLGLAADDFDHDPWSDTRVRDRWDALDPSKY